MKRIGNKLTIGAIAIAAIVLIATVGGYAYWSVQKQLTDNQITSGHMAITVLNGIDSSIATSLDVAGIMPGQGNKKQYAIQSTEGNPNTDLWFKVTNVTDAVSLADNVELAFLLNTDVNYYYWLTPAGAQQHPMSETFVDDPAAYNAFFPASDYDAVIWQGMQGYTNLPALTTRHITVYYRLPVDCADDCHDDTLTFDMDFGLSQYHV